MTQGKDDAMVHREPLQAPLQLVTVGQAAVGIRCPRFVCGREVNVRCPPRVPLRLRVARPDEETV
jgi:hypothetical protein